jgi:hypothetical protein
VTAAAAVATAVATAAPPQAATAGRPEGWGTASVRRPAQGEATAGRGEFERELHAVLELESRAQFAAALQQARTLRGRPGAGAALDELIARLTAERDAARDLAFAVQNLASPNALTVRVARRQIEDAGETGRLVLRNALRGEGADPVALGMAKTLAALGEPAGVEWLAARYARAPDAAAAGALAEGLGSVGERTERAAWLAACGAALAARAKAADAADADRVLAALRRAAFPRGREAGWEDVASPPTGRVDRALAALVCDLLDAGHTGLCERVVGVLATQPDPEADPPAELRRLDAAGVPPARLVPVVRDRFHRLARGDRPEATRALADFAEALAARCERELDRTLLMIVALDGRFVAGDYAGALAILDGRKIPGWDEDWYEVSASKVRAHKALQEGRAAEAVPHFRKFMTALAGTRRSLEPDPVTGLTFTREMLLGRNAARIAELLEQAGEATAAQAARSEAQDYYRQALARLPADGREAAQVREELAKLAGPAPKP